MNDAVVVADSERKLRQLVTEFGRVCERRKLRVNVGKSKGMSRVVKKNFFFFSGKKTCFFRVFFVFFFFPCIRFLHF